MGRKLMFRLAKFGSYGRIVDPKRATTRAVDMKIIAMKVPKTARGSFTSILSVVEIS